MWKQAVSEAFYMGILPMSGKDWQMGVWIMWKKGRTLAACLFAAAWWGIFYPELCFTEETCELVQTGEADAAERIEAAKVWQADNGEIVVSSRFLEWCEETLFGREE